MQLIGKLSVTDNFLLGNQKKKFLKKMMGKSDLFKDENIYRYIKTKENIFMVLENKTPILISFNEKNYFYTLKYVVLNDIKVKKAVLDDGAYEPVLKGANIMAPGIYKYKDLVDKDFVEGEIIYIYINNQLIAAGLSTMALNQIKSETRGICIDVVLRKNDFIDNYTF